MVMTKMFLFLALFSFAQASTAQSKIPDVVKKAFSTAYPNATDIDWEKENGHFEAEFEIAGGKEISVVYDANGNLLETEEPIAFSELPKPVQAALKGKKVKETAR